MILLLDNNLSPRIARVLGGRGIDVLHVRDLGLARASDAEVWEAAADLGAAIVTRDADFQFLSVLRGGPPKVVWLRVGNCSTSRLVALLEAHLQNIEHLARDEALRTLEILG